MASTSLKTGALGARRDSADTTAAVADPRVPTNRSWTRQRVAAARKSSPAQHPANRRSTISATRRVALVTANYDTVADGVSRTLTRLVDYLRRHDFEVLVVGPDRFDARTSDGPTYVTVPSVSIPGRSEYQLPLGLPKSARRALEAFAPQLVHIATPDLLGVRSMNWATAHGVPVVSSYHTHFPSYLAFYYAGMLKPAMERYLAWFYRRCRHVYVPTPMLEEYAWRLGLDGRIRTWGRGVDCQRFSPSWRSESWRRERGLESNDVLVTFVGRLVREKGLDVVAAVIDRLTQTGAPIRSMIVGDGPLRGELEARLPRTFFTGHLEDNELTRAYAGSDVFLFPSETEAFGNVIVEAMASGLPIVAAAATGSSCHVHHESNGLLVEAGNVEAFSMQTLRLVLDGSKRRRMGSQGRLYARSYDWDHTLARLVDYYEELID